MSLNRYVNDALSSSVHEPRPRPGTAAEDAEGSPGRGRSVRALRLAVVTNVAIVVLAGIAAVLLVLAIQRGL